MRVCLICIELFGDSIYGGFGRATRFIGRELVRRGMQVSVVVPRRSATRPDTYELDGMAVHQFCPQQALRAIRMLRHCRADVYHSQDTSIGTLLAQIAAPRAAHIVTFRDPMDRHDWKVETDYANMPRLGWTQYRLFIDNPLVAMAVRRADRRYCAARFLIPKTTKMYGLKTRPDFLPSPVQLPREIQKAERPTVCYVGRWEGRKRVERFFELAEQCPEVDFIALGGARDPDRDRSLRERYGGIPNLRMTGVLDQFVTPEWAEVLGRSWILVNSSLREGLPTSFIEAAAHRCAILAFTDPDGFATKFGVVAQEQGGGLKQGLQELLRADRWKALGQEGRRHVEGVFSTDHAMEAHCRAYEEVFRQKGRGTSRA